ncbi:DUF4864 domain-containing protein [Roseisalinus antarcticus]|uniref:DUF4864 domain-containing protein n=1 Tax=Roseisalinus antarcticus TaxID=254357 RepID=A0A1Y5T1U0_9RHOB|nr:DUF4864 domain-containing protein [Roseisalinus antarcticus]SLN51900.1 hypothetical protein ROA7023_02276 [Roseisalinus antarcticus]
MLRQIALSLTLALFALTAQAQEPPAPAIEEVISSQLQAFNDRDLAEAFQFASPMIKGMFGNPATFGMMVQRGYPMVWTNSEARFLELREIGGALYQKVMIRDAAGSLHVLDYKLIETADGWQIDGVGLLPAPDLGV